MTPNHTEIVHQLVDEIYQTYPWLWDKFGEHGKKKTFDDNIHHFENLELSYTVQDQTIFLNYTVWLNDVLTSRGVSTEIIINNFQLIRKIIKFKLHNDQLEFYDHCLIKAIESLEKQS